MVHAQVLAQNPHISYKELAQLERIDRKKAREQSQAELAKAGLETVGSLAKAAGTALVGPVGLVTGFLLINYLEKGVTFPGGMRWVVKGSFLGTGPETLLAGPYEDQDTAVRALSGISPDWHPFIATYRVREGALDSSTALTAKTALTAAGLGTLLKTVGGALT